MGTGPCTKRSTRARAILAASAAVAVIAAAGCQPPTAWVPERLDLGTPPGSMSTASQITFTANGTRMVFVAFGGDFGPTDTNGAFDVYVRDLITGTNELVSVNADGTNSGQGSGLDLSSIQPQLSADGTKVAFVSEASDLVPGGTSGRHIYVRDLVAGTTHLVTADAAGTGLASGLSGAPAFSPDGTKVAFLSYAGDLTPEPVSSPLPNIYVRDLIARTTTLVSADAHGSPADSLSEAAFLADGRVVFQTRRDILPDVDGNSELYVKNLQTGAVTPIPRGTRPPEDTAHSPVPSPDGRYVAFTTESSQLYLHDLLTGETTLVTHDAAGGVAHGGTGPPRFMSDGRTLVFTSTADNLEASDADPLPYPDLFAYDVASGGLDLVSAGTPASTAADNGVEHELAPDGTSIVFVEGEAIYRWDIETERATLNVPTTSLSALSDLAIPPADDTIVFNATDRTGLPRTYSAVEHENDVTVELTGQVVPAPTGGRTLTYRLDVTNDGPDDATSVTLALAMPSTARFSSATGGPFCWTPSVAEPSVVACDVGAISAGGSRSVTVTGSVAADPSIPLSAFVVVRPTGLDPVDVNNSDTLDLTTD